MKKLILSLIAIAGFSAPSFAVSMCYGKVLSVFEQNGILKVIVTEKNSLNSVTYRIASTTGDSELLNRVRLSIALSAKHTGKEFRVDFPDGTDCTASVGGTSPSLTLVNSVTTTY